MINNMITFNLIEDATNIDIDLIDNTSEIVVDIGDAPVISDYTSLKNKPKINEITLVGNKSLDDLGIQKSGRYPESRVTNIEIDALF